MNVFNVHVNRYPVSGTVRYVHYNPGKFLNAAAEKSSLENEQTSVGIESGRASRARAADRRAHRAAHRDLQQGRRAGRAGERMGIIRSVRAWTCSCRSTSTLRVKVGDMTRRRHRP